MNLEELETAIEEELSRLKVAASHARPEGLCVYTDADSNGRQLPRGWVRISDGTGEAVGPADAIVAVLAAVPETGTVRDDGSNVDWEAAWEALGEFSQHAPKSVRDWPADLVRVEQLEEGTPGDNPNCLIVVETNDGTRYAAGPHGANYCALWDWDGPLAATKEEAVRAGVADEGIEMP